MSVPESRLATPITLDGVTVPPGKRQNLEIPVARLPTGTQLSLPVTVINGRASGPCLWISAAIHGDELNGVEIIRQVLDQLSPKTLHGKVIAVPIVNIFGFIEQSRYLPDRRDLNRSFPGSPRGSLASRLAHLFMREVVSHSTHGIDLHTASLHRTNLPQIRANLADAQTSAFAHAFGAPVMIQAATRDGSLRQAAVQRGIPILLYEAGEALRFDQGAIATGVRGVLQAMAALGMVEGPADPPPAPSLKVEHTKWVRASRGGILHLEVGLGEQVTQRQRIGFIDDAFNHKPSILRSPFDGIVIGHSQNPLVNQGDGIVHIAAIAP